MSPFQFLKFYDERLLHFPQHLIETYEVILVLKDARVCLAMMKDDKTLLAHIYALTHIHYEAFYMEASILKRYIEQYLEYKHQKNVQHHLLIDQLPYMETWIDALLLVQKKRGASDMYIEFDIENAYLYFRIQGMKVQYDIVSIDLGKRLIRKIKLLSHLHLSDEHLPQDGMFERMIDNQTMHLRVATMPGKYEEHLVLRYHAHANQALKSFFEEDLHYETMLHVISKSSGLVILTGPTGSGKTSSLYSCLLEIEKSRHIVTIEDPIEMTINYAHQIQISESLSFSEALKHVLRMDPDVILIGEIRDETSAMLAIRAALTGHLVLTTLHVSHPLQVIKRLNELGISLTLINETLSLISYQRLIPLVCETCAGQGCPKCHQTGYEKRKPIIEMYVPSSQYEWIKKGPSYEETLSYYFKQKWIDEKTYQLFSRDLRE
jgi:type II secretory ATPase GspE/PulE/Tfp pilus assembly ATPase PilB-like protein